MTNAAIGSAKIVSHQSPGFLQFGYVTNDLDRAIEYFRRTFGVQNFFAMKNVDIHTDETDGSHKTVKVDIGFAWWGETMIEIIKPQPGSQTIYSCTIDPDGYSLNLHHMGVGLAGPLSAFEKKADEMRSAGYKLEMLAINANGHYVYVDTRKDTGHHTELLWFSEAGVAFLAKIPRNPN
ncbi:MAG: hypothetical protein JWM91_4154 [Rhodospirillales bacterium]|nr:hypothetical protein [Rhodospirillales bacterium]